MEKTYKFRLYPSKQEAELLNNVLYSCRYLYNSQLEYEKLVYEKDKRFANRIELNNLLPDLKIINSNFKKIHSQVLQNVNDRVIKSFDGFFGRVQKGQTAGYPRFKNSFRYNSFSYPQSEFKISKNKLKLSKIGKITIKLHRQIRGEIKTLTIIKTPTNNWYACFCVSWNKFRQLLVYKAEEAGCKLDFQNPRNTSKRCCGCGQLQDMPLSKRVFSCRCGNTMARDLNSAINILNKSCFFSV